MPGTPVTGHTTEQAINAANDVRLDNSGWVLPNRAEYQLYPVARYSPSYNKSKTVSIDGVSSFKVVDPANPTRINNANLARSTASCTSTAGMTPSTSMCRI